MKPEDEKSTSGLFLGSEPLDGGAHERHAKDHDTKDHAHGPKDTGDDDSTDKGADGIDGDSDGTDEGDSDGTDGVESQDADGKD